MLYAIILIPIALAIAYSLVKIAKDFDDMFEDD